MSVGKKILWGGLGWVLGGPIGAIVGYSLAGISGKSMNNYGSNYQRSQYPQTQPGDFIVCLLVLFGAVMKADNKMLKSELNFVKNFLSKQFSHNEVRNFIILFKDIIKQDYPLRDVCKQIVRSMDHPSRLELVHILFGLSNADGQAHANEINLIRTISGYLNININDFNSIKAMFVHNTISDYSILEINPNHPMIINLSNNLTKIDHKRMSNLILDQANILDGNILSNPSGYLENLTEIFIK